MKLSSKARLLIDNALKDPKAQRLALEKYVLSLEAASVVSALNQYQRGKEAAKEKRTTKVALLNQVVKK